MNTSKIIGIGFGILTFALTCMVMIPICLMTGVGFNIYSLSITVVISSWIYFRRIFPHCLIEVPPDYAWVVSNRFKRESSARLDRFSGYRDIRAQRELQAGPQWKWPWEEPILQVDMSRRIVIQNQPDEAYTLPGGKLVLIKWTVSYVVLPGNVVNFTKSDFIVIERKVRNRVEKFLQSSVGELHVIGFGKTQIDKFKEDFKKLYNGPEVIDDEERELGIWTGTPEIYDIDEPRDVQEIRNILRTVQEAVAESKGKMTYDEVRGILLAAKRNGANVDVIELAKTRAAIK